MVHSEFCQLRWPTRYYWNRFRMTATSEMKAAFRDVFGNRSCAQFAKDPRVHSPNGIPRNIFDRSSNCAGT